MIIEPVSVRDTRVRVTKWRFTPEDAVPPVLSPYRSTELYFAPSTLTLTHGATTEDGSEVTAFSISVVVTGVILIKDGKPGKRADRRSWSEGNIAKAPQWIQNLIGPAVAGFFAEVDK